MVDVADMRASGAVPTAGPGHDAWGPDPVIRCFHIRAVPEPSALPRIVSEFSRHSAVPSAMVLATVSGLFEIRVEVPDLTDRAAELIALQLGRCIIVVDVTVHSLPGVSADALPVLP